MTVAVVDTEAGLAALVPEWRALWASSPGATPFQHPAWLLPWWAAFGTGEPRIATWHERGILQGILPAYILDQPDGRKMLPIGAGTTDYLDALGTGGAGMLAALLDRCMQDQVSSLDLIDIQPGSSLPTAAAPSGWRAAWGPGNPCPVLPLADIPSGIRRKLRMNRNRAHRAGGWAVQDAGPAGFETLVALHQARWTAVAEPGVLQDAAVLACLRGALGPLDQAGLLRLQTLTIAGRPAAAIMALLAPGRIFFYLSGYDAAQAFTSPGTLLLGAMLEQAAAEDRTEAHFLRGQEAYKYAWGATDRLNQAGCYRPA